MNDLLLPGLDEDAAPLLERELRSFIDARDLPLYRIMSYQMGWVDERGEPSGAAVVDAPRVHGQLVLAVARALGAETNQAIGYALPVELAHNAALIHQDVEDGNTDSQGRPSVWWTWGPAQAINAGDGMQAIARLSLFTLLDGDAPREQVSAALAVLDDSVLVRCEGEYLDISYQERLSLTVEQYFEMAEARGGGLMGGAAALGGVAARRMDDSSISSLSMFGRKLGAALHVNADMRALWGERDQVAQGRLISKKKNLAIIYAIEHGTPSLRRKIGELYMQRVLDPGMIDEVARLADSAGGREFCQQSVDRLFSEAESALGAASIDEDERRSLIECGKAVVALKSSGSI